MHARFEDLTIGKPDLDGPAARFAAIRRYSTELAGLLSPEDCAAQSMPDASPVKWHLAHTTWFFEVFVLERFEPDFAPFHQAFRVLFNSYYNGIGEKHARPQRGLITRPSLQEVLAYRRNVDDRIAALLTSGVSSPVCEQTKTLALVTKHAGRGQAGARPGVEDDIAALVELGLQHEQQHQELIVTDAKHLLSLNPLMPAYGVDLPSAEGAAVQHGTEGAAAEHPVEVAAADHWVEFAGGITEIGASGEHFCFDNEMPRHRQFLEPYALSSRLVTNAQYAAFIADGGYENPGLWLSEGWDWVRDNHITQPLYWHGDREFTLQGLQPRVPSAPALHLSFYEAAAYASHAGARLPTEAEWEHAAGHPELSQMFGAAWQWTSSSYAPYPGFKAAAGAIGEYNGKFMVNQYVLRGSSPVTPPEHSRTTYRNFFPAAARWQFTGIRLAR
jgi:ergothioneine biosynthesis protein EgtB